MFLFMASAKCVYKQQVDCLGILTSRLLYQIIKLTKLYNKMNFFETILSFDHLCHNIKDLSGFEDICRTELFKICANNLDEYIKVFFSNKYSEQTVKVQAQNDYLVLFTFALDMRVHKFSALENHVTRNETLRLVPERRSRLALIDSDMHQGVRQYFERIFEFLPVEDELQFLEQHMTNLDWKRGVTPFVADFKVRLIHVVSGGGYDRDYNINHFNTKQLNGLFHVIVCTISLVRLMFRPAINSERVICSTEYYFNCGDPDETARYENCTVCKTSY